MTQPAVSRAVSRGESVSKEMKIAFRRETHDVMDVPLSPYVLLTSIVSFSKGIENYVEIFWVS